MLDRAVIARYRAWKAHRRALILAEHRLVCEWLLALRKDISAEGKTMTTIADVPTWLRAWIEFDTDDGEPLVLVYRSIQVRKDDPIYRPVAEYFAAHEVVPAEPPEIVEDEMMMFGEAELSSYRLVLTDVPPEVAAMRDRG
jgi:hypothetical protein